MYIYNEKAMKFQFIYYFNSYTMLNSPLNEGEKWEICDSNIFLDNINSITRADAMFLLLVSVLVLVYLFDFGLALMVDSQWKHLGEMEIQNGGIICSECCFVMPLMTTKFKLISSVFLFSAQACADELKAYMTESQNYKWTKISRADFQGWTH